MSPEGREVNGATCGKSSRPVVGYEKKTMSTCRASGCLDTSSSGQAMPKMPSRKIQKYQLRHDGSLGKIVDRERGRLKPNIDSAMDTSQSGLPTFTYRC